MCELFSFSVVCLLLRQFAHQLRHYGIIFVHRHHHSRILHSRRQPSKSHKFITVGSVVFQFYVHHASFCSLVVSDLLLYFSSSAIRGIMTRPPLSRRSNNQTWKYSHEFQFIHVIIDDERLSRSFAFFVLNSLPRFFVFCSTALVLLRL